MFITENKKSYLNDLAKKLKSEIIEHRNFVLLPLFEIAKNWKHPVSKVKIAKLISFLKEEDLRSIKQI